MSAATSTTRRRGATTASTTTFVATGTHLRRLRWAVRATLTLGVAASVAANVLHARPNPISQMIAAWPPLALLLTVELISRVPHHRRSLGVIRIVATTLIAAIATWVSYWHLVGVAARYGETEAGAAYLLPISVDGLVIVASVSLVEISGRIGAATSRQQSTPTATPDPVPPASPSITPPPPQLPSNTSIPPTPARRSDAGTHPATATSTTGQAKPEIATVPVHMDRAVMGLAADAGKLRRDGPAHMPYGPPHSADTIPTPGGDDSNPVEQAPRRQRQGERCQRPAAAGDAISGGTSAPDSVDEPRPRISLCGGGPHNETTGAAAPLRPDDGKTHYLPPTLPGDGDAVQPAEGSGEAPPDDAVPSQTAAAVAYWHQRHPHLHPAEIAARIGRSERTVRRHWPPRVDRAAPHANGRRPTPR